MAFPFTGILRDRGCALRHESAAFVFLMVQDDVVEVIGITVVFDGTVGGVITVLERKPQRLSKATSRATRTLDVEDRERGR